MLYLLWNDGGTQQAQGSCCVRQGWNPSWNPVWDPRLFRFRDSSPPTYWQHGSGTNNGNKIHRKEKICTYNFTDFKCLKGCLQYGCCKICSFLRVISAVAVEQKCRNHFLLLRSGFYVIFESQRTFPEITKPFQVGQSVALSCGSTSTAKRNCKLIGITWKLVHICSACYGQAWTCSICALTESQARFVSSGSASR